MPRQPTLVGNTVLMVIDIQKGAFLEGDGGIPHMDGYRNNMERARGVIDAAHENGIPVVFFQEIHRRDLIDYGRELDGSEGIHCMEGEPGTPVAVTEMDMRPTDYFVHKRRYSVFFGTETEILLKGLKAETLIMVGGMTDVCVHYSFADIGREHPVMGRNAITLCNLLFLGSLISLVPMV
ncbi:MAG: isochorismatase family cysteine hydrolase, partial [Pseudomonadota bacterium]